MFNFLETSKNFPKVVVLASFPPAVYEGSFFHASLPKFIVSGVLDNHSNRGEVESLCSFDLHFL
jgi:hypothetical protein